MASADSFVVKVKYENTLRRITMAKASLSFDSLKVKIAEMFKVLEGQTLVVTYQDNEGDVVTMGDDADFHDAVVLQALNPLRLDVKVPAPASAKAAPLKEAGPEVEAAPAAEPEAAPAVDAELPKAAEGSKKVELSKLQRDIDEKLRFVLGGADGNVPAALAQFEPLLRTAPAKLAEVIKAARTAGLQASFEPSFTARTPAPQQATSEPASAGQAAKDKEPAQPLSDAARTSPIEAELGKDEAFKEETHFDRVCHRGVQCDGCGMSPIVGPRFKSIVKEDYDLCRACYVKQGVEGDYNKIEKPLFRPGPHPFWGQARPVGVHGPRGSGPAGAHGPYGPGPFFGGRPFHMGRGGGCHRPMGCRTQDGHHGNLDARFVKDVSIFDGTEVAPNAEFTKIWRLRNSGNRPWPEQTQLVHVGGDQLGSGEPVMLQLPECGVTPGNEVEISVDLVAPPHPGRYVSHWRLLAPGGPKFGHRIWALIQVVPAGEPSPQVPDSVKAAESVAIEDAPVTEEVEAAQDPPVENAKLEVELHVPVAGAGLYPEVALATPEEAPPAADDVASGYVGAAGDVAAASAPSAPAVPETPKTEATSVGGFAFVEHPGGDVVFAQKLPEQFEFTPLPEQAPLVPKDVADDKEELTSEEFIMAPEPETQELERLVAQLQSMGFPDAQLNKHVLEVHGMNVEKALDELVAAGEWDEMLEELEEMGFNDKSVNRRLMFKNKGSVKHVVKELVQMYKNGGVKA